MIEDAKAPNPYEPPAELLAPPRPDMSSTLLGSRFQAMVLDNVLTFVIVLPALLLSSKGRDSGSALVPILTIAALWAYQWYLVVTTGQTLGKRWSGIRIVKVDGSPLTFVSAVLLRSWAFTCLCAVPGLGALLAIADVLALFGQKRRSLHDQLAGTTVIRA